jgi:hypothetical protein
MFIYREGNRVITGQRGEGREVTQPGITLPL